MRLSDHRKTVMPRGGFGQNTTTTANMTDTQYSNYWAAQEGQTGSVDDDAGTSGGTSAGSPSGSYGNVTGNDSQASGSGPSSWFNDVQSWFGDGSSAPAGSSAGSPQSAGVPGSTGTGSPSGGSSGSAAPSGGTSSVIPYLAIGAGVLILLAAARSG
jgi:hypothetical protein